MSLTAITAALWLAVEPAASRVDVSGGAAVELRGGRAPVTPLADPEWSMLSIITPEVAMETATRRGTTLRINYAPRVQQRLPNVLDIRRPLLLHQNELALLRTLTPRWNLGLNLASRVGETDYNSSPAVLDDDTGAGNAAAPDVDVLQIVVASGVLSATGRLTRRHTLELRAAGSYRGTIGDTGTITTTTVDENGDETTEEREALPDQTNVTVTADLVTRVTPADRVGVALEPGYFQFGERGGGDDFTSVTARTTWDRAIHASLNTSLTLGVFGALADGGDTRIIPTGLAEVTGVMRQRANHRVSGTVGAGVTPYFDRVTSTLNPRATATANLSLALPPRWTVRGLVALVTNATAEPIPTTNDVPFTETAVRLVVPATYEINDEQQFEFGLIMAARAPHLASNALEFNQLESWLYVAYRIGVGTARGGREVGGGGGPVTRRSGSRGNSGGSAR
ncbi:MAG: hypothetical protein AAGA54_28725 [Myxococcota bacterium]